MNNENVGIDFVTLDACERKRLAEWLSGMERVRTINLGRWHQLCDPSENGADYISAKELAALMDCVPPYGFALEIISGKCRMRELTEITVERIDQRNEQEIEVGG